MVMPPLCEGRWARLDLPAILKILPPNTTIAARSARFR